MKKKKFLKFIIVFILIIIGIKTYTYGIEFKEKGIINFNYIEIVLIILSSLLMALYIVNYVLAHKIKHYKYNSEIMESRIFKKKELAEQNYTYYYKKVKNHLILGDLYFIFVFLLQLTIFILLCLHINLITGFLIVISGLIVYSSVSVLVGKEKEDNFSNYKLTKEDYPDLWSKLTKIAKMFHIKKKLTCYFNFENNASVSENSRFCTIIIGVPLLYMLNDSELENILIHEFTHIYKEHTKKINKILNRLKKWQYVLNQQKVNIKNILYSQMSFLLGIDYQIFEMVSSKTIEISTDEMVMEKGDSQIFINALAKMAIYRIFEFDEKYTYLKELYEPENFTDSYFNLIFQKFSDYYGEFQDFWKEMIVKRIPSRIESHLTFPKRMEFLNVDKFEIDFSKHLMEMDKIITRANKIIKEDFAPRYQEYRKHKYLIPLERMEKYEKGENLSRYEMIFCAEDYRSYGNFEKALEVYEQLLNKEPNYMKAIYQKGTLLLSMYNKEGINLIYKAIELNDNYLETGINIIAEYCLKMGLQDEVEKVREYMKNTRDYLINIKSKEFVNKKDRFLKTHLDDKTIKEVIDEISSDERIQLIYMADKMKVDHKLMTVVGVKIEPKHLNEANDIMECIYDYLDNDRKESFYLLYLNQEPYFYSNYNKVKNSLKFINVTKN